MGIKEIFHKIKAGFTRCFGTPVPRVSDAKRYGDSGEDDFVSELRQWLPSCKIKRNIMILTPDGNAEIDCLVLYENKLAGIEIKNWKGRLIERKNGFVQEKTDRWTGEIHERCMKSPFRQLSRAIYLLRRQIPINVYINGIVFFENEDFETIKTKSEDVWFCDIKNLVRHIIHDGRASGRQSAYDFFMHCKSADYLYSRNGNKSLHCIISDDSLKFRTPQGETIGRKDIRSIEIIHHWSYDELLIKRTDGRECLVPSENAKLKVNDGKGVREYSVCKLTRIYVGGE